MSTLVDEKRTCRDCQNEFTFTARDQEFFTRMQFAPPSRCKPCRDKRKAEKEGGGAAGRTSGGSTSNPIREYRPGNGNTYRNAAPEPERNDKGESRRSRGNNRRYQNDGGSDW